MSFVAPPATSLRERVEREYGKPGPPEAGAAPYPRPDPGLHQRPEWRGQQPQNAVPQGAVPLTQPADPDAHDIAPYTKPIGFAMKPRSDAVIRS